MDMEELTILQLATVMVGSLLTSQKIDLEETEEVDRIIKESIRIVKKTKQELNKK
jgi:hypothetical protein